MRILILNQFYPPDMAPTGRVAHDLARCLVARGHEVSALASRRGYSGDAVYPSREVSDGVVVRRVAALSFGPKSHVRKLLSYASFYFATALRLLVQQPRPDVVIVLTTPPYIGLLVRLVGFLRRWRRVHWVMDVYPDVMEADGMLGPGRAGRLVAAVLRWLTRRELAGARIVLTLGPDMAARCRDYVLPPTRLEWVPLWAGAGVFATDEQAERQARCERGWEGKLVLLYSGNMGLGHRFEEFLAAARALAPAGRGAANDCGAGGALSQTLSQVDGRAAKESDSRLGEFLPHSAGPSDASPPWPASVHFVFAGGGVRRAEIEAFARQHPGAPIDLLPYAPAAELAAHLRSADVLLASLEPAWAGCMVPSKLQGMLAAGRPALFVGPRECFLARAIEEAGAGWVVAPGDVAGLRRCIELAQDPAERARRGAAARAYAAVHFDRDRNSQRLAALIEAAGTGVRASTAPAGDAVGR
jgi:colanic acid biosynthesis glycosyl transferase WcaI